MGLLEVEEFRTGVLHALHEALPSKFVSLNELSGKRVIAAIAEPPIEDVEQLERWNELGHENPLYQHYQRTGVGRAYRFSDITSREQLESTRLYQEFYLPVGVHHQMAFTLPSGSSRIVAIALSREEKDYSDREREFLTHARPFLIQAYRNALAYSTRTGAGEENMVRALGDAGLTPREAEVLRLVARGSSSQRAGRELGISERTVDKHLEHVFAKLSVSGRSEAAALAWEIAASDA